MIIFLGNAMIEINNARNRSFELKAIKTLQVAGEDSLTKLNENSICCAIDPKSVTLQPRHMQLAANLHYDQHKILACIEQKHWD